MPRGRGRCRATRNAVAWPQPLRAIVPAVDLRMGTERRSGTPEVTANAWLAIDVGTAPMVRAQELRLAWERWVDHLEREPDLEDDEDPDVLREPIAASWRRSYAAGINPVAHRLAPVVADEGEIVARWEQHPLARAAPIIRECLAATAEE